MSGIYIPDMEMPTSCSDCLIATDYYEGEPNYCYLVHEYTSKNGRLDNCPLVPVPPHGRLIDADALNWVEGKDEQDKPVYLLLKCQCDDIPTVIEADKEVEG